jgi:hypothetical protein
VFGIWCEAVGADHKQLANSFWLATAASGGGVAGDFVSQLNSADQSQGELREILVNVVTRVTKVASVISLKHSYLCHSFATGHGVRERLLNLSSIRRTLGRPGRHSTCSV